MLEKEILPLITLEVESKIYIIYDYNMNYKLIKNAINFR
jgi:hypothetical protein